MRELGLAPQVVQAVATAPLDAGAEIFSAQMARADRPDALFFANDNMAAGAIYEAARAGIRIPEQCAVAGFGDFPFSEKLTPALTTIRVPRYDIGRLAAQAILLRLGELEEGSAVLAPEPLPYELIARADVPAPAAISEYVEVAKAFDAGREAGFVNGLLDGIAKDARG